MLHIHEGSAISGYNLQLLVVPPTTGQYRGMIEPPQLFDDHPDYAFECEQALERAVNEIGDAAISAGWNDAAVDAALLKIIRERVFGRLVEALPAAPPLIGTSRR